MNINRCFGRILTLTVFTIALTTLANAQATRTWVSGVGDDVNPCSRTAPCKTFAGAISKTFINGEIDALDPGGYGTLTITKSITVDGGTGSGWASVLASGAPTGFLVNIPAGNVNDPLRTARLRNLSINGAGASGAVGTRTGTNGIRILAADQVYIEDTVISDFSNRGISDERTTGGRLYVDNCTIRNNGQSGVVVISTTATGVKASINNSRLEGNVNAGVAASNASRVTISNSVISGNTAFGLFGEGPSFASEMNVENCISSNNGTGVTSNTGTTIRISNNTFTNNGTGIQVSGGSILSFGNNRNKGNTADGAPSGTVPVPIFQ